MIAPEIKAVIALKKSETMVSIAIMFVNEESDGYR